MKAIILAAGKGDRLYPLTRDTPKCLLNISGKQCILGRLINLFTAGGISEIIVVVGFLAYKVETYLATFSGVQISTVYNPFFSVSNSIVSCWLARQHMHDDFLLINGDTVIHADVLSGLLQTHHDMCIAASHREVYDEDAMKLLLDKERQLIRDVGQDIPAEHADGESMGFFKFTGKTCHIYRDTIEMMFRDENNIHIFHHNVIREIVRKGHNVGYRIFAPDLWEEVDFMVDLERLRSQVNITLFE